MWRLVERIPFCIVDKVITPPLETASSRDNTMPYKRMLRWLLENSTCLISCLYQELYERESRWLWFTVRQKKNAAEQRRSCGRPFSLEKKKRKFPRLC